MELRPTGPEDFAVLRTMFDEPSFRGWGGARILWTRLTVDPDTANLRGIRFWSALGFRPVRLVSDVPHREAHLIMEWSDRRDPISRS